MRIKDVREVEASAKGLVVVGKIAKIFDGKRIQGTKNGKDYDFVATSIKLEDDTGSIYTQFTDVDEDFLALEGKTISCISCSINEYVDKQGVTQRSLRASSYSAEVVPETSQPELPEVQIEDPAHPVLPKTVPVKEESPAVNKPAEEAKPVEPNIWAEKDLRIVRQNSNLHATTLVCKYFKGTLEESIAKVIEMSNILVSSVYQGLKFPINEKQADLLKGIKAGSDEKVASLKGVNQVKRKFVFEKTPMEKKILELKSELNDDIEFTDILVTKFGVEEFDSLSEDLQAEFATELSNLIIKKGK